MRGRDDATTEISRITTELRSARLAGDRDAQGSARNDEREWDRSVHFRGNGGSQSG
ncbi:hypothetical protein OVA24_09970 [Luteolibacter sp. SL250]|uniref:hypothetical protein n=1 Tax=Luteolibacter sp. SL250 TaxID=2995170 RepID=UPI00226F4DBC|nr:hypothetical protein [Luteolibacter sp. SL250]WAC21710.1 hypothetical protein OVA24_09970 [Luteolibacter sp. SL250]